MWQAFSRFVVGEPTRTELPQRVRETIARQQENSEILIGWAQLTLVVLFGVLYAISPKTSPMMGFEPVPVALALYLLFTVGRLAIACKRKITSGVLMASIVMDISLLMFLIWTFHIQYEQPPSFYLKAPTMLYVFIFIGLRALRFDPRYILATGAAAVAGWGILMTYVMVSNPQDAMITRNYVEYMTSNAILVGAEIDKMVPSNGTVVRWLKAVIQTCAASPGCTTSISVGSTRASTISFSLPGTTSISVSPGETIPPIVCN